MLRNLGRRMQQLQEQAMRMQEQAMAMHQHQHATPADPGGGQADPSGWDPLAFLPAPSMYVKRGTCASCGAPKQLPTVRQYLYCDFCGQLNDYDLRRASEAAVSHPSTAQYAAIANQVGPEAARVSKAGDVERYRQLQTALYDAQVEHTPWAVPPRAWADPAYAQQWVRYSTEVAVLAAFDPIQSDYADQVRSRSLRLQWKGGGGLGILGGMVASVRQIARNGLDPAGMTPMVQAESFWPLADVVLEQVQHLQQLIDRSSVRELDPDHQPPAVADRLARSVLAQGWLRMLEDEDGQAFIQRLGLRHEYSKAEVAGEIRHCAGCGHDVTALPGATCVVCDGCGRRVDLTAPQIVCSGCNARIAFAEGVTHQHCPYCQAEVRRI